MKCVEQMVTGVRPFLRRWFFFRPVSFLTGAPNYVPKEKVWGKISAEAPAMGLDPKFVYAICHAEQFGRECGNFRGQGHDAIDGAAWVDATELHYRQAFDWETNAGGGHALPEAAQGNARKPGSVFLSPFGGKL